jgi:NAD-dependent SIR2 family protein deacetylase
LLIDGHLKVCGNPIKPKITFVGEALNQVFYQFMSDLEKDENGPDLVLILGTKLEIISATPESLAQSKKIPTIYINPEKSPGYDFDDV